jgi:hypothetical protein
MRVSFRVVGGDDLVEAAVLDVVLELLAEVLLGGGPVGAVELGAPSARTSRSRARRRA